MNELMKTKKSFDEIRHIDEFGNEFWMARELMKTLEYGEYRKFFPIIKKGMESCKNSEYNVFDHFVHVGGMITVGKGATRKVEDYKLSRYACYLIVQNADPRKEVVALGQTYFAIQTRRQEILESEYYNLPEDEKRRRKRRDIRNGNYSLNKAALDAGVKDFGKFHNSGYKGLYDGETADDIAKRKGLRYREDILDNMGSDELIANLFRISQTEQKLKRENIKIEKEANDAHFEVGREIRNTIMKLGGTLPENLPTPEKSIKDIEKENKKYLN